MNKRRIVIPDFNYLSVKLKRQKVSKWYQKFVFTLFISLTLFGASMLQLTVDIYQLKNMYPFDLNKNKGRNDLTEEEVHESFLFKAAEDADMLIILGPPINGQCHLVLARFHNPKTLPKDKETLDELFSDLIARASKKGFESQRKGGSNGYARVDKTLMKFLSTIGTFPRPSKNIVILQGKTKWECLYMSTND